MEGLSIYASPNKVVTNKENTPSPKQLAWRKRVNLLWRIKGIYFPIGSTPLTQEEKEKLSHASTLISEVVRDFTVNSVALGLNAVNRCFYCGKPAVFIGRLGHYVCEKHKDIYNEAVHTETIY